ncbi:NADPH-cytochrome P450 reductase, variant [Capsaspora owczarzaki ATCC 30864]|nr:NADPH-cytochrome P450 reductase, variant [Capsaspora owczarzaki ATCC 30864]
MKRANANMVVLYGSQTGTAEDYAGRLAQEARVYGFSAISLDLEDIDVNDIERLGEIPESVAVFCMATYGEGDPTDNAQAFYDYLKDESPELSALRYIVFGLGNKTYEHYNAIGRFVDEKLAEFGASRLFEHGEGDDDGNLEEDFIAWKAKMWPALCKKFNKPVPENVNLAPIRQYKVKIHETFAPEKVFTGEMQKLKAYENQRPPFDSKNPFLAPVRVHRELHTGGDRSCMHIELDIAGSGIKYEAGDHVGVFATNDPALVEELGKLVGNVDLDSLFSLEAVDARSSKKSPFPCPCTFRTALLHYVDILSQPRAHLLRELAEFASDPKEKEFLEKLTTEEGKKDFQDWIQHDQRTILDILRDLPSVKPPMDLLLEFLPRLQCRYYSISSSPKAHPNSVHITAVLVKYTTKLERDRAGIATSWLKLKKSEATPDRVPIFIRRSTFKLPKQHTAPIIMVGPGTGLAPFRGFLHDRRVERSKPTNASVAFGETVLFFGCRSRHHDYIYETELKEMVADSTLSEMHVAFSRDQNAKEYVTHHMTANKKRVWDLVAKGAHIYVCGDARNMARNVHQILLEAVMEGKSCDATEAANFIKKLQAEGRYSQDVWT